MRTETVEYKIYTFDELSAASKKRALEALWNINVDYDWWDWLKDDAESWGATRFEFDLTKQGDICLGILEPVKFAKNIVANVGDQSRLYKPAKEFLDALETGKLEEDTEPRFITIIEREFYDLLRIEYGYLTSEDAIIETIKYNYEFLETGEMY